jgi:hypothetical protein
MTTCKNVSNDGDYTYSDCSNSSVLNFLQKSSTTYTLTIPNFILINKSPSYINVGVFNPQNYILTDKSSGASLSLYDAYVMVGTKYINITYSCALNGTINTTLCPCTTTLQAHAVQPYSPNNFQGNAESTVNLANVPTSGGNKTYNGSSWIELYKGVNWLMQYLYVGTIYSTDNCGCFADNPYVSMALNLKVDVVINLKNFCTIMGKNNINYPICYNYISDVCTSGDGCNSDTSAYLADYCNRKFPVPNGLNVFNKPLQISSQDYNLCGCNMPQNDYDEFENSLTGSNVPAAYLGSVDPHCLVPACYQSPFKPATLNGCPVPQCVNVTSITQSNIAGNVNVEQNQECDQLYNPPSALSQNPWSKYGWIILILVFIIVIAIIAIIIMFAIQHSKKSSNKSIE